VNGVLPIDKPTGPTSHDAVAAVRRALGTRQVGHTGTLDPFASGLLLVCAGPATRLAEYLTAMRKTYVATMRLGEATNTDDLMGEVFFVEAKWAFLRPEQIEEALQKQVGTILQQPPVFSAKKVGGKRSYQVAREGETVDLSPVRVTIYSIRVLRIALPDVDFEVECGAGTYIRAIARDVGNALGVGGHLRALRRTKVGPHSVDRAVPLDALGDAERVRAAMLLPLEAVSHLARVTVDEAGAAALAHGRAVAAAEDVPSGEPIVLASSTGELLAIGERDGGVVRPRKVFAAAGQDA
jgi:tRNA pseudouridine55 synthase